MKTEEHNKGVSLRVPDATCDMLCRVVSSIPGAVVTARKRPFFSVTDGRAEFTFRGHGFVIEPDEWDGVYWILSKGFQKHEAEMQELRDAVEKFTTPTTLTRDFFRRIFSRSVT